MYILIWWFSRGYTYNWPIVILIHVDVHLADSGWNSHLGQGQSLHGCNQYFCWLITISVNDRGWFEFLNSISLRRRSGIPAPSGFQFHSKMWWVLDIFGHSYLDFPKLRGPPNHLELNNGSIETSWTPWWLGIIFFEKHMEKKIISMLFPLASRCLWPLRNHMCNPAAGGCLECCGEGWRCCGSAEMGPSSKLYNWLVVWNIFNFSIY